MMTEADEIAASIWRHRSALEGNALNATFPIRACADAERVTKHYMPDEGASIRANVSEALWRIAKSRGGARN